MILEDVREHGTHEIDVKRNYVAYQHHVGSKDIPVPMVQMVDYAPLGVLVSANKESSRGAKREVDLYKIPSVCWAGT